MAVEARHLSLFSPQIRNSREMLNFVEGNGNVYGGPMGYGMVPGPVSGTTTAETLIPMYGSTVADAVPVTTPMKSDSGLTYAIPLSRKRPREDAVNNQPLLSFPPNLQNQQTNTNNRCGSFSFLGEYVSLQLQQQQLEIDRFIAQHTEKVRMEIEERRKRFSRRIIAAAEESIMKKLRAKEEEVDKIGKLNWALEERVKSLCVENQIWRDLAQTNEAAANALKSNLEQVLAQVHDDQQQRQQNGGGDAVATLMDDAQSCCGSNYIAVDTIKDSRDHDANNSEDAAERNNNISNYNSWNNNSMGSSSSNNSSRLCRNCGKGEPSVLLLPCRHLCLCSVCGPSLHTCPICKSTKNASVHVNLSSSS